MAKLDKADFDLIIMGSQMPVDACCAGIGG